MSFCKRLVVGILISAFFFIIGLITLAIILSYIITFTYPKIKYKGQTDAYKIDVKGYYDSDDVYMYSTIYYFKVLKGTIEYNYICESLTTSSSYPDLSKKKVYYNEENPKECLTEFDANLPIIIYLILIVPFSFMTVGIFLFIQQIKYMKSLKSGVNNDYSGQNSINNNYNTNTGDYNSYNTPGSND